MASSIRDADAEWRLCATEADGVELELEHLRYEMADGVGADTDVRL